MLHSSINTSSKSNLLTTAAASFMGILAAIPISLALFGPDSRAVALQDQATATSQTTAPDANYAQYIYAYNQGYLAQAANTTTASSGDVCSEASVMLGEGNGAAAAGVTQTITTQNPAPPSEYAAEVNNSYNNYQSYVHNSASTVMTNSNNTVGSNNVTTTSVKVDDSHGVMVHTDNTTTGNNLAVSDSFNKDSYNTETDTTIINDSFNKETTVIKDSGNTTTVTENVVVNETDIDDSYNSTNTAIDNSVDNSGQDNSTDVDVEIDAEIEIEQSNGGGRPQYS